MVTVELLLVPGSSVSSFNGAVSLNCPWLNTALLILICFFFFFFFFFFVFSMLQ